MRRETTRAWLLLLVSSCAPRGSAVVNGPSADPGGDGDRADPCDMCLLQRSLDSASDDDGCPEPDLRLTEACTLSSTQEVALARAATDLVAQAHVTSIRLVSGNAACARAVQAALEKLGLPRSRFEVATRGAGTGVTLEVGAWDGTRCEPPSAPK